MFHGYAYRLNWVSFALAKHRILCLTPSSYSSSILHGALYTSIEFWRFSLDTMSGPIDCGASYPLGARIVRALHHSGWCTASSTALTSCLYQHQLLLTRLLETTLFTWLFWPVCSFYHTNWFFTNWSAVLATHHHPFLVQWWINRYGHGMHWPWNPRCFWIGFPDSIPYALHSCGPWHSYNILSVDGSHAHFFVAAPPFAFIKPWLFSTNKRFWFANPPNFFFKASPMIGMYPPQDLCPMLA